MRPSLSPFENGAYGTPSSVVSVEVGGPHEGSVGNAATKSLKAAGMSILVAVLCFGVLRIVILSMRYSDLEFL